MTTKMMTKEECKRSLWRDPNNILGRRNRRNTPPEAYNCGGLALAVYNWVAPYVFKDNEDYIFDPYTDDARENTMLQAYEDGADRDQMEEIILQHDVEFLLKHYSFLQLINSPDDCAPDETVIAYRIFIKWDEEYGCLDEDDFHFKIRYHGFWFEKPGSGAVTVCQLNPTKPWRYNEGDLVYTSRIAYFKTQKELT